MMMLIVEVGVFVLGLLTVWGTLTSAVRSFVVPRADNVPLTRWVFIGVWSFFLFRLRKVTTYEERDRIIAYYAPSAILLLPAIWVTLIIIGYMFMYWAVGVRPLGQALRLSGSSVLTLGAVFPQNVWIDLLVFSEATIGLGIVALILSYLPTMYSAFSRRESQVALLETWAGDPPSPVELLVRVNRLHGYERLVAFWRNWEMWFTEVEESHTSLAPLIFFRSPKPSRSWLTASGVVLDSASLTLAVVDIPRQIEAALCVRAGYVALRSIADFFVSVDYDRNPKQGDPISITREEFEDVLDQLAEAGVPLKSDREQMWLDYAGWRVNYDAVLLALANRLHTPYAMWVSDRGRPLWLEEGRG